jgi:hypothetical protein
VCTPAQPRLRGDAVVCVGVYRASNVHPSLSASLVPPTHWPVSLERCESGDSSREGLRVGFREGSRGRYSRGRYATYADFPRHDGSAYWGLRVRRRGLRFVHHSRTILCRAVPKPQVTIRNFFIAVRPVRPSAFTRVLVKSRTHVLIQLLRGVTRSYVPLHKYCVKG